MGCLSFGLWNTIVSLFQYVSCGVVLDVTFADYRKRKRSTQRTNVI